jgi:hypothetical protein
MSLAPSTSPDKTPGFVAAWALSFWHEDAATHKVTGDPVLTIASSDYDADLDFTLQSGLSAGTFTKFSVYSIDDTTFGTIQSCDVAKLYVYYADTGSYLKDLIGLAGSSGPPDGTLVADLRLVGVKKKKYEPPAAAPGGAAAPPPAAPVAPIVVPNNPPTITALTAPAAGTPVVLTPGTAVSVTLRSYDYQFDFDFSERIYDELASKLRQAARATPPAASVQAAITELLKNQLGLEENTHYKYYSPASAETTPTHIAFPPDTTIAAQIAVLGGRHGALERLNNVSGRGMLLIRDGVLHIGKRPIPLTSPIDLNYAAGLLDASAGSDASPPHAPAPATASGTSSATDAAAAVAGAAVAAAGGVVGALASVAAAFGGSGGGGAAKHKQWTLTLRGRPDIKPGDVVRFKKPPEFAARTSGSLGVVSAIASMASLLGGADESPDTSMYVETVQHKLGRRSGFSTTLTGIDFGDQSATNAWDPLGKGSVSRGTGSGPAVAAAAVRTATGGASGAQAFPNVGEIRQFAPVDVAGSAGGTPSSAPTAAQTGRVWTGLNSDVLDSGDGGANPARRADIDRDSYGDVTNIPYLTPFALGKCGLVLPRYPNTRVLLAYRKGNASDPIDVGSLWQTGHAPSNAAAGDWWLSLPAYGTGTQIPSTIDDADTDGHDYDGKVSQDLIDGHGQRAIDVASLRIRAGADSLDEAGTKVTTAPSGTAIVIEHTKNGKTASITINDDASIEIKSDTKITFTSGGDIEMHAANVAVHVSGHMDVSA